MNSGARQAWVDSLSWQVEFYARGRYTRRLDPEFEWTAYERAPARRFPVLGRIAKRLLHQLNPHRTPLMTIAWLRSHAEELWSTRCLLTDDLSRLLFDAALTVRMTDHRQFYFPRIDFDDLLEIVDESPFDAEGFPREYLGVPLRRFKVKLCDRQDSAMLEVVTRRIQLQLVNSYRQYLVRRDRQHVAPQPGDVVYDCGACIGEISILFAGLVAPAGEVHLFDPMPLHTRFCAMQARANAGIDASLHINTCAVGDRIHEAPATAVESTKIEPGAVSTEQFACTTLDDYASRQDRPVDFIKMDIEGAEVAALTAAHGVLAELRPRLAISAYHKPEHLWEIPQAVLAANPTYKLAFGHHTPITWESVFYATAEPRPSRRL
ncbi:MAG: FkbM family methyltransferase [Gammaproteobacteria bacterium]